jgi:SAM-dependent methyltransferase
MHCTKQEMLSSNNTYRIFADFYDDYAGKFTADLEFYRSFTNPNEKIIEIGCGTGRILEYFLNDGHEITGVDISPEMLQKAAGKLKKWSDNGRLNLLLHDFSEKRMEMLFDKALVTFYTFNYIFNDPVVFLKNIHDSLRKNGLLLMDLFYPASFFDKSIDGIWTEKEFQADGVNISIRDNRKMKENTEHRQQIFSVNGKETKIDTYRKYYNPAEIKELILIAGFQHVEMAAGYDIKAFGSTIKEPDLKTNFIVKAIK